MPQAYLTLGLRRPMTLSFLGRIIVLSVFGVCMPYRLSSAWKRREIAQTPLGLWPEGIRALGDGGGRCGSTACRSSRSMWVAPFVAPPCRSNLISYNRHGDVMLNARSHGCSLYRWGGSAQTLSAVPLIIFVGLRPFDDENYQEVPSTGRRLVEHPV